MKIYTSYYARASKITTDALYVCVSNSFPDWFKQPLTFLSMDLSPRWSDINSYKNGLISYEEFSRRYVNGLPSVESIRHELENHVRMYDADTLVLLCWEKDINTCHRKALAEFISNGDYCGEL